MLRDSSTNRAPFKRFVREAIEPVLGINRETIGGRIWEYYTPVGKRVIDTIIEFGNRNFAMRYHHDIRIAGERQVFASLESVPGCLGVFAGQWFGLLEPDFPAAAASLALLCRRFLKALPSLLPE